MTITVKHETRDFWGNMEYREDTRRNAGRQDVLKAFRYMKNNMNVAIEIDGTVYAWDSLNDYNELQVLVIKYSPRIRTFLSKDKVDFNKCKKQVLDTLG